LKSEEISDELDELFSVWVGVDDTGRRSMYKVRMYNPAIEILLHVKHER
jgi:hypothetical protein